jgi:hypothetical protein
MPFTEFDRTQLHLKPLNERKHEIDLSVMMYPDVILPKFKHSAIKPLADKIISASQKGASVVMMMGAHVIRSGAAPLLIDLIKKGYISHIALNGAGAIHDFELALIGKTTESVAKYISNGQFGLWEETGQINEAAKTGVKEGIGLGEAIGKMIVTQNFEYKDISLLAAGYTFKIPITIHVGIGCDIIHEHPNCDGSALGKTSYSDFLIFTQSISHLENGVFMNFGSAVTGPEVYLKSLAMARNVAHQHGKRICNFTTAVFDLLEIDETAIHQEPRKGDALYYFRPWKTILSRTIADGGESFYIKGRHRETVGSLFKALNKK